MFTLQSVVTNALLIGEPATLMVGTTRVTVTGPDLIDVCDCGLAFVERDSRAVLAVGWEQIDAVQVGRLMCSILPEPPARPKARRVGPFIVHQGGR